jgi:hypothetical protein
MTYYAEAQKNETDKVWDRFNRQENSVPVDTSKNITSVNDQAKKNIGITVNDSKNIEDKYYGEDNKTFDNDVKYFNPSDGLPSTQSSESEWLPILLGFAAIIIIPPFFM